ncbi:hypothetical protein ACHMW7_29760 [Aminobacter sp. UC22_36]|uniref:hypothetical protein n=1 Tax=Aminobacter sp. UC22_36 TaxID=3374549 RepID=UPI0037571392
MDVFKFQLSHCLLIAPRRRCTGSMVRVTELTAIRDQARSDAERAVSAIERIGSSITKDKLGQLATAARRKLRKLRKLRKADGGYRRDYLRAMAQCVEVVSKTEIRIVGNRTDLLMDPGFCIGRKIGGNSGSQF